MGVGSGLYMYDVVVKRSRSLSHLLMSCISSVRIHMDQGKASRDQFRNCSGRRWRTPRIIDAIRQD